MRIRQVTVTGLFGRFNHVIDLDSDEKVTIMIGPNGSGKTMILRLIYALFNESPRRLMQIPFRNIRLSIDDGSILEAERSIDEEHDHNHIEIRLLAPGQTPLTYIPEGMSAADLDFPTGAIEDMVPRLNQVGAEQWHDQITGQLLGLDDVLDRFGDQLPDSGSRSRSIPDWLKTIRDATKVRLIDTERLTRPVDHTNVRYQRSRRRHPSIERTVRLYSDELQEQIQRTLAEYGTLSQSLDRTFPARIVEASVPTGLSMEELKGKLGAVENKRSKLIDTGLLQQEKSYLDQFSLDKVDKSRRDVLAVYAADAQQKLGVFDRVFTRIDMFQRIANARLMGKHLSVSSGGFSVTDSSGTPLDLEMLSSGEQHELVFLYSLLFQVGDNSLILFDEPELSLHVAWQDVLLDDLVEIAQLSEFHVLLATHSPQIIGDRWSLAVELKVS